MRLLGSTSRRGMLVYLGALFAVIQGGYLLLGVRFDCTPLTYAYQIMDVELLRTRLLESSFYLHSQPPGFNLFLGAVLKLFPQAYTTAFWVIYLSCGLVLYGAVFLLQRQLGVSRPIAFVLSTLFIASPSFVLWEHHLFYTFPLMVLLTVSALLFHKSLDSDKVWWLLGFFFALVLLCVMRSLFQLMFYFGAAALLVAFSRNRKRVAVVALVMLVPILSLYVKNWVVFDMFGTSSWMGEGAWMNIGRNISTEDRQKLVREGKLSELALIRWYSPVEDHPAGYTGVVKHADIPVLSETRKSTGGVNYNHEAYIRISDQRMRDFLAAGRYCPKAVMGGVAAGCFVSLTSTSDYGLFTEGDLDAVAPIRHFYDFALYGKIPLDLSKVQGFPKSNHPRYVYMFLLVGLPLLLVFALRRAIAGFRHNAGLPRIQRATILYLCLTILYVAVVANTLGGGENNRYRFKTDPMYLALLGMFLQFRLIPWFKRRLTRPSRRTPLRHFFGRQGYETVEHRDAGV